MVMTHYMELLSLHSPWFLIIFMVIPVVFIETIFMAEAFTLLSDKEHQAKWRHISHYGGIFLGLFFIAAPIYLVTSYIPTIEWRGPIDYIAVWSYVLAIIPAILLLLKEFGFIFNGQDERKNAKAHIIILILFVVFTHVAMVFGMADPRLAGYKPAQPPMKMDMPMAPDSHAGNGNDATMPHDGSSMNEHMDSHQDHHMNGNTNDTMNSNMNNSASSQMNGTMNGGAGTSQNP